MEKKWQIQKTNAVTVQKLAQHLGVSNIIAHLLCLRGISTFDQAKTFFRPKLTHLENPFLMKNMGLAVKRIEHAIQKKQRILVYGDYDVDGTTSVAMMYLFLKKHNKNIQYYIPCRYEEGYGISKKGIDYAYKTKTSLIIALDCGIRAVNEINYAKKMGIDFIICDHHMPSEKIPVAAAVLNPKQIDCKYPYKDLSGCGVGFKLIQAYCQKNKISFDQIVEYLDLLAISIGADIVPITGENRVFAFYGLKQINLSPRIGLQVLIEGLGKEKPFSISDMIFGVAPRINAAGRIKHANKAVEVLIEQEYNLAKVFAKEIEEQNNRRKELDQNITKEAVEMIDQNKNSTVLFSDKWHKGVVGIVASRLIESYYRPTIIFSEKNGILTGSARSVHDFDIYNAISKCSYLLEKYGGHKYAAGLTIKKKNIYLFIDKFEKVVSETISKDQQSPKIEVDMEININDINEKFFRIIKQFAPFGPRNLSPVFISRGVFDNGYAKQIGDDKLHLRLNIKTERGSIPSIGFGMGEFFEKIKNGKKFDVCYSIQENIWNGRTSLQLILKDIKPNVEDVIETIKSSNISA